MNKIINRTVLLVALILIAFACQSPELDTTGLNQVITERESLTINRVQYVQNNINSETFAITLASEGVGVSYNDTWQPTYYGHGYFIQFEVSGPTETTGMLAEGTYYVKSDTAAHMVSRAYLTVIHDGATATTAQVLALTDGTVEITETDGNYTFNVDFTTVLGTNISGATTKAEKINVENQFYWFEPTAEDKVLKNAEWNANEFSFTYTDYSVYSENVLTLSCDAGNVVISYNDLPWDYLTKGSISSLTKPLDNDFYTNYGDDLYTTFSEYAGFTFSKPYNSLDEEGGAYEPNIEDEWGGKFQAIGGGFICSYILMNSTEVSGYSNVYWIIDGTLDVKTSTVDEKEYLKIVADLQTSNGSTIKVTYDEAAAK